MPPVTTSTTTVMAAAPTTPVPPSPTRSRKRSHPNDENVSPSPQNSPSKSKGSNLTAGLLSIRNYFLPAAEEDSCEQSSPKKLKTSSSVASLAPPPSPPGTVSFITSTPKRVLKSPGAVAGWSSKLTQKDEISSDSVDVPTSSSDPPRTKDSPVVGRRAGSSSSSGSTDSPARQMLDSINAFLHKQTVAGTKSLLDIFSPLRSSLTRTDSLVVEPPTPTSTIEEEVSTSLSVQYEEETSSLSTSTTQETDEYIETEETEVTETTTETTVIDEFNPYYFIKHLPPPPNTALERPPALPPKDPNDKRLTLVLDLDETLVHCSTEDFGTGPYDYIFDVAFGGTDYHVLTRKRPFLEEFLRRIAGKYEVVVFTASQQVYADKLLDLIGAGPKVVEHRLFRDSCVYVEGNYLKDLRVLGRDLSRVVLVDNSPLAYGFQIDNGIPIESWYDDKDDRELLRLVPFLEALRDVEDVRPLVRSKFKTYQLVARA